jgi:hypothetical protein
MCIAIYKDKDVLISKETLEECYRSNPDGAGFMYVEDGKLSVHKGYFTFDSFYEAYQPHEESQAILHFRIKTHGPVDADNCHPFVINDDLAFVHNGVISGFGSNAKSDTLEFNASILQPLVEKYGNDIMFDDSIKTLVESKIGYSKLIFLDNNGRYDIFNEHKGVWDGEVWFSNHSYKPTPVSKPAPVQTYKGSYPNSPTANVFDKPVNKKPLTMRTLKEGDEVYLTRAHYDEFNKAYYPVNTILEVAEINSDWTANLLCHESKTTEYLFSIPFSKLDFFEDVIPDVEPDLDPLSRNNNYPWRY